MFDLIIVGGGPGAAAAGIYAARKKIKTLLIAKDFGGQSKVSAEIQNWVGFISISGSELAKKVEEHLKHYADDILEFDEGSIVTKVTQLAKSEDSGGPKFEVETDKGKKYEAKSVIIASGSRRRKLEVPGAEKFDGKGIVYCATCDSPLFKDKEVAVIGGGNAGLETAQQLLEYASKIFILEYGEEFRGDLVTREALFKNEKIEPITMAETKEIKGDQFVSGLVYKDRKTEKEKELSVQGVFVEIGSIPNSDFVKDLVEVDKYGEIVVVHKTMRTSVEGIWAAGDVTDQPYKQNNIAMGDAVKSLEDVYIWLQKLKGAEK